MLSRVHIFISGRVQGVFFRSFTRKTAIQLGICGWVRNLRDGRVEVLAEGEKEVLEKFIKKLQIGPEYSKVDDLDITWEDYLGVFKQFIIRY
ncbi:MAG TPA: acylphosphatase [Methanosarcinales archaeon]|nr:acylphosphatase [Methanosarcinales archaeon]